MSKPNPNKKRYYQKKTKDFFKSTDNGFGKSVTFHTLKENKIL